MTREQMERSAVCALRSSLQVRAVEADLLLLVNCDCEDLASG